MHHRQDFFAPAKRSSSTIASLRLAHHVQVGSAVFLTKPAVVEKRLLGFPRMRNSQGVDQPAPVAEAVANPSVALKCQLQVQDGLEEFFAAPSYPLQLLLESVAILAGHIEICNVPML